MLARALAAALLALPLAGCPAPDGGPPPFSQQASRSATQLHRLPYQRLYLPLYPSAATPRLTPFGDFDTPRAYRGESWRHRGIDIVGAPGDPVIAAAPGLACAGYDEINGRKVTLYPKLSPAPNDEADLGFVTRTGDGDERFHPLRLIYGHLRGIAPALSPCRYVELGERLGTIGASGIPSVPHLHFEIVAYDAALLPGDPSLGGALNPFFLMRREPGERLGTIACYQEGMGYRPNSRMAEDSLNIVWPTLAC